MADTPAKALIRTLDGDKVEIPCLFNPKEYSVSKSNKWSVPPAKGQQLGEYEFGGGDPAHMTLQLLFDTFESGQDVRKVYTDKVWKLMWVDQKLKDHQSGERGRPPRVQFQWGEAFGFEAVITSITQKFILFRENGVPVRATLDVSFQQIKDELFYPNQNPTSGGMGGGRQVTVKEGDTLTGIAYSEYGDSSRWRAIADANRLTQVRRLRPGLVLEIPNLA
jgi:contractile injection system tube protein/LysM domain-containing protein